MTPSVNIGKLRRRLQLQSSTATRSASGQPNKTWSTYARVWGEIRSIRGGEAILAQQVQASGSLTVEIRYRADVRAEHRMLTDDNRILDINNASDPDGLKRRLILLCSEAPA